MIESKTLGISLVVPFYNEQCCLESVCREAYDVLSGEFGEAWELIMVDDGSTDETPVLIDKLADRYDCFRAIHVRPNSGQSAALEAGFRAARAEIIGTMDGDGQNDPRDVPVLLEEMKRRRVDMMCGIRTKRADNLVRRLSSRLANRTRSAILKDNISDVGCSLRVFRRCCLDRIRFFRNAHRFFPALMIMAGYKVAETPVNHRRRKSGVSKYGGGVNSRLWTGIVDLAGVYWLGRRVLRYRVFEGKTAS